MNDWLLALWIVLDIGWAVAVFWTCSYLVFWRGHSGWWFVLAVALCANDRLYKVLHKRFGLAEEKDDEGEAA